MNNDNKTALILHGHFYQPPRENPLTGIIEKQESAAPQMDWNEKIYTQCYKANADSRYLSSAGRIIAIENNYKYISFNFGHTLLSWIEDKHPIIHEKIVEADKDSIRRLGHGNAMAQGFNHTILPLDKKEIAKLQIAWGQRDFYYRFKREAEGIWLPECAVNENVVDYLAEAGIKFIVLSPWQCAKVEDENGNLVDLGNGCAPYCRPYILTGKTGKTVSCFFYHPGLASDISFGHALRDADKLYKQLVEIKNKDKEKLIHTATDGEIYGHHEPFGDMALAALIKKVNARDDFEFTNYAAYLEKNPATLHAVLKEGEEKRGTSWSCSHGVSRWYKDCGCHTGGEENWNQKWRTPLRNSLNILGDLIDETFNKEIDSIFKGQIDSYSLLLEAGKLYCGELTTKQFITQLHSKYDFAKSNDTKLAEMLAGYLFRNYAFTSCGFFFSDIGGLEPRKDIKYAIYAANCFQKYSSTNLLMPFLAELSKAESNVKKDGDGMQIAQEEMKGLPGEVEAAVAFTINRCYADKKDHISKYGRFVFNSFKKDSTGTMIVSLCDEMSLKKSKFTLLPSPSIERGLRFHIEGGTENEKADMYEVSLKDLPQKLIHQARAWISFSLINETFASAKNTAEQLRNYAYFSVSNKDRDISVFILEKLGLAVNTIENLAIHHYNSFVWDEQEEIYDTVLSFIEKFGRENEKNEVKRIFSISLDRCGKEIRKTNFTDEDAHRILNILSLARRHGFEPETENVQNAVFEFMIGERVSTISKELAFKVYQQLNFDV
ncbi:MAG: DUF3536 domain-containing protein [Sphaerochaetaceae bacterium]|nr:DUF3536 domain-containing protein [Sphaerochaetaceae bacterium]